VATDDGAPYISNEFNHYKSQCVYAYWYLTGDRRSREHWRALANNALKQPRRRQRLAARGIGRAARRPLERYELTRDSSTWSG